MAFKDQIKKRESLLICYWDIGLGETILRRDNNRFTAVGSQYFSLGNLAKFKYVNSGTSKLVIIMDF